jgi:hypothetical protein
VLDGAQAGVVATADANGQFWLAGTFDAATRFRATKDGHATATETWTCAMPACGDNGPRPYVSFYLVAATPAVDLAGDYTVTFTADSACPDLPSEIRTRTYAATLAPSSHPRPNGSANTSMTATLSGASFFGAFLSFEIGVAGDFADFWLDGGHDPPVVEQLATNTYVAFSGNATANVSAGVGSIAMPLDGWIDYCVTQTPMGTYYLCGTDLSGTPIPGAVVTHAHCDSQHHQLTVTRR